jgi:hypothetical protein
MAKYRIVKINDTHFIQAKGWLGWKIIEYYTAKEDAIKYLNKLLFKNNPYYIPKKDELILEVSDD